jgi:2-oxoglutarate dehydrogenase E2 component (dihydrolipoamide succinyltransferase)
MSIEVRVPPLPESVPDATLVAWHKKAGESVQRDENLVDLETDKVVLEVPAPSSGVLQQVLIADGQKVRSDDLLAVIDVQDVQPTAEVPATAEQEAEGDTSPPEVQLSPPPTEREAPEEVVPGPAASQSLAPSVRRLVAEHRLDPAAIPASGRGGRLTKEDVLRFMENRSGGAEPADAGSSAEAGEGAASFEPALEERPSRRVPMSRLRARIAERLVQAQRSAAMLTTMNEIDMQSVMDLRHKYREEFARRHGVKLGLMSFFVKACVEGLTRFPVVNASVDGDDIIYHDYYDIGIAVDSPRGLVVPVLRNADRLSFATIETDIAAFGRRAQEGTLGIDDLSGGTFTISNGGVFGSLLSTPILNPPQSAILGMHKIEDRPVAEQGEVRVRPMMYVALSYDHRIIDGRDAVRFLVAVKAFLEDPVRLLLEV